MNDELDPDTTDVPDVIRAHQSLADRVERIQENTRDVQNYIQSTQAQQQQQAQQQAHRDLVEEIYTACDDEHGAQHREAAIQLADSKVGSGEADKPDNAAAGLRLMQKCYAEVAAKTKAAAPPRELNPQSVRGSTDFKPGTLDEVVKDMKTKMAAGKWKRAFGDPGV